MIDFGLLTLQVLDLVFVERGQHCKRAGESSLAEPTVTNRSQDRVALDSVANGAACAAAKMGIGHLGSRVSVDDGSILTWRKVPPEGLRRTSEAMKDSCRLGWFVAGKHVIGRYFNVLPGRGIACMSCGLQKSVVSRVALG